MGWTLPHREVSPLLASVKIFQNRKPFRLILQAERFFLRKYPIFFFPPMNNLTLHGQENIVAPAFYLPNRLSVQACKALNYLLQGRLVYLTDSAFPLLPEIECYLREKRVLTERFDFLNGTPKAARETLQRHFKKGRSVVFMPGQLAKVRGCLADVPKLFLVYAQEICLPISPLFLGFYGNSIDTLYRDVKEDDCCEEFYVLPQLPAGAHMAERLLAVWLEKSSKIFSSRPLLNGSLTEHLVRSLRKHGAVEMIDGMTETTLPYYKILGVAMTMATQLRKRREQRIGVILPPGPGGTIALLACMLAGITPVIINYASSAAAFQSTVQQAELKSFITARQFMKKLPSFSWPATNQLILVEELLASLPKLQLIGNVMLARFAPASFLCKKTRAAERHGEDEVAMLFTAGSTGEPKGVALTHRMVLSNIAQSCCRLVLNNERVLGSLPLFHSFGFTIALILPLLKGRPICTYPNPTDARTLCQLIEKYELTMLCATPTFARAMLRRADPYTFATVRYFIVGAERLSPDLEREYMTHAGVPLLEGYGLTEAAPVCAVNLPDETRVPGSAFSIPCTVPRSVGYLLPGIAVRITDVDDDKPLPLTAHGMIWLKGPNMFHGYTKRPELNASVFKDGWFKTGDIGSMDLNGFITLDGRLSRFSKVGGEMVPHEAVEELITRILKPNSDRLSIAITGVLDAQKGEAIALLTSMPDHQSPAARRELISKLRAEFPLHGIPNLWAPRYVIPVREIPLLASGKQDLSLCRRMALEYLESESS